MFIRGKFVKLCNEIVEGGEGAGGSGGAGDFDFTSAGDTISADLFGTSSETAPGGDGLDFPDDTPQDTASPEATEAPQETSTPAPALEAPKTWRPEAAAHFATLPSEVQKEILKREEDIFRGLEGYKADASIGKALKSVVQPYTELFQSQGIDPMQQVSGLMRAHIALATGTPEQKQQFFQHLASEYGVELSGEMPYVDPQVADLQKQLASLQSRLNGREQQEATQARAKLQAEIEAFASDPAHTYFDEVANDIAGLLKSGAAKDLSDAYEKAIWANPITRAKEQARLTVAAEAKAKTEAAEKVKQARRATSVNVRSSAKAASGTAPTGSIDDTLNEALSAIRSRA